MGSVSRADHLKALTPYFRDGDPARYPLGCVEFAHRTGSLLGDMSLRNWQKFRQLYQLRSAYREAIDASPNIEFNDGFPQGPDALSPSLSGVFLADQMLDNFLNRNVYQPLLVSALALLGSTIYMTIGWVRGKWSPLGLRRRNYSYVAVSAVFLVFWGWKGWRKEDLGAMNPAVCLGLPVPIK